MSSPLVSRRTAMLNTLALTAGALIPASALLAGCKKPELTCTDTSGLSADEIAARSTLKYVDHAADPAKKCDGCQQFKPPQMTGACGACVIMKGPIHPEGSCNAWAKKVSLLSLPSGPVSGVPPVAVSASIATNATRRRDFPRGVPSRGAARCNRTKRNRRERFAEGNAPRFSPLACQPVRLTDEHVCPPTRDSPAAPRAKTSRCAMNSTLTSATDLARQRPDGARADEELLARIRSGDTAALEALVAQHQPEAYRFARRLCRNDADAEDVLQETMLALVRHARDLRGDAAISTWLFQVARSFCIKKRRTRKGAPARTETFDDTQRSAASGADADAARPDRQSDPERAAEGKELQLALDAALDSLDDAHREVLVLRDMEGLTAPEVARVLGIGVPAVKSRLHRARLSAREALLPLIDPPGATRDASTADASGQCPDVLRLFSRHLEGEIDGALCARMEAHLARCPRCRRACDSLKQTLLVCRSASAEGHDVVPPAVQGRIRVALRDLLSPGPERPR